MEVGIVAQWFCHHLKCLQPLSQCLGSGPSAAYNPASCYTFTLGGRIYGPALCYLPPTGKSWTQLLASAALSPSCCGQWWDGKYFSLLSFLLFSLPPSLFLFPSTPLDTCALCVLRR